MKYSLLRHRLRMLTPAKIPFYFWKLTEKILLLAIFPIAYAFMCIYSAIRRKKYRVAEVNAKHLGGWAHNLDGFLRRKEMCIAQDDEYLFVLSSTAVSNIFFYELMKRYCNVVENIFARFCLLSLARVPNRFQGHEYRYLRRDELAACAEPFPWFDEADNRRGAKLLKDMGIGLSNAWFVCVFARDNAYNESTSSGYELDYYNTYHACRNADIETYMDAIKYVLDRGGYVIRMGSVVKKRVSYEHPKLIDYPFSGFRSDFADVFLATHCRFFIGTGSGIVDLSVIRNVPLGMVDHEMYTSTLSRVDMLYIPKLMKFSVANRYVTIREYMELFDGEGASESAVERIDRMEATGIIYEDNSEDDVLMIARALYDRFIENTISDQEWMAWQEGGDVCQPYRDRHCRIWGPFIDKHRCLM